MLNIFAFLLICIFNTTLFCNTDNAQKHKSTPEDLEHVNEANISEHRNKKKNPEKDEIDEELAELVVSKAHKDLQHLIERAKEVEEHPEYSPTRILLTGETGCGKTTLALAIAKVAKREVTIINASSLENEYQSSGAQNIKNLFIDIAQRKGPQVIVIEEMDSICKQYYSNIESQRNTAKEFWLRLDEIRKNNPNILVIGTTNDPQMPSMLESRFNGFNFELTANSEEVKLAAFKHYLKNKNTCTDETIKKILTADKKLSMRDIREIVIRAESYAFVRNRNEIKIDEQDLRDAALQFKKQEPSLLKAMGATIKENESSLRIGALVTGIGAGIATGISALVKSLEKHRCEECERKAVVMIKEIYKIFGPGK